jgi:hypothetical protein
VRDRSAMIDVYLGEKRFKDSPARIAAFDLDVHCEGWSDRGSIRFGARALEKAGASVKLQLAADHQFLT